MRLRQKISAFLLTVLTVLSVCSVSAFAAEDSNTIANINDAMKFVSSGVITIKEAKLYKNGEEISAVYVVGLSGTNGSADPNDIRGTLSCMQSAFSVESSYVKAAKTEILANVPKDSKIVLIGHSLGGMTVQQLAADKSIKGNYEIINTLGIGSPYIPTASSKEGDVHRIGDRADIVPGLSLAGFGNIWAGNMSYESSGYVAGKAHKDSYEKAGCWLKYDCFGIKNGTHKIVY